MDVQMLDFAQFEEVPSPVKYYDIPRLSVTSQGVLTMNGVLREMTGEELCFQLLLYKDGRYVMLRPDSKGNIRFSPRGVVTHRQMKELLLQRKIQLPACYLLEWCEEKRAWIGCSDDLPEPPSVKELLPSKGKRRGRTA